MDATPDTVNYMIGGYVLFTIVMMTYVISLVARWNNLKQEEITLNRLEK